MGNFPPYDDESTTVIQSQPNSPEAEEAVLGSVVAAIVAFARLEQLIAAVAARFLQARDKPLVLVLR